MRRTSKAAKSITKLLADRNAAQANVEAIIDGQPVFFKGDGDDLNKFVAARIAYVARLNAATSARDAIAA